MILKDSNGNIYKAHFRHVLPMVGKGVQGIHAGLSSRNPATRDGFEIGHTECTFHAGSCSKNARPCETPDSRFATAHCSIKDTFCRATGRKVAFGRAIHYLPKALRRELWQSYLKQNVPIGRAANV